MTLRDLLAGATEDELRALGEALAPYTYQTARIQGDVRDDRKIRITAAGADVLSTAAGAQLKYPGESYADHLNFLGLSVKVSSSITGRRYDIGGGSGMNADYVVDATGAGTHLSLYGATGALQAALATGLSAFIWICTTHTETLSAQEVLPVFAAGQQIIVASGTRERGSINVAIAGATLAMTIPNANGAGSSLSFKSMRFTRVSGTGALIGPAAGGPTIIPLEFENVDFKNNGSTFDAIAGGSLLAAMTTSSLTVRGCTGAGVLVIQQLSATSNSLGAFTMEDCAMTLEGVNRQSSDTSVDWGTSAGGVSIRNNVLTITTKLYKQNYDMAYFHIDDNIFIHSSANTFIRTGVVQTGSNIHIVGNSYTGATAGCSFLSLESATSNIKNCNVTGNNLKGPGSGTAIQTVLVNTGALPDSLNFLGNTYRDWTTNFDGTAGGATDDVTNPNPDGSPAFGPSGVNYLIGTADAGLASAIVVGTTPGGELGNTWASPTVDATHSGSAHHAQGHAVLSADHTDTTAAAVSAGAMIRGNAGGTAWEKVVVAADGLIWTLVAGVPAWAANASAAGGGGILTVLADPVQTEWTNQPAALTELFGLTNHRTKIDLTNAHTVRLVVDVQTAGVAGSLLRAQYSTDAGASWHYFDGVTGPTVAISATGTVASVTVNLEAGAKADVLVRVVGILGDGAADPAFGLIVLQFDAISGGTSVAPPDAKYVTTAASGGLSAEIVLPYLANYNPDKPPASPSATDDEFDDDSIGVGWTSFGTPDTLSESATYHGFLKIEDNDNTECGVWEAYVPGAAALTVVTKLSYKFDGAFNYAEIVLLTSANANLAQTAIFRNGAATTGMLVAGGPSAGTTVAVYLPPTGTIYLMTQRDSGTNYLAFFSMDGKAWFQIASFSQAGTVARVRLGISGQTSNTTAYFDFVRMFTTQTDVIGAVP